MIRNHRLLGRLLLGFSLLLLPAIGGAQELYTYTVGVLGGIGTEPFTHLVLRTGKLALDRDGNFGTLSGADMKYVTIGGEYRYSERFYESGVFAALGAYQLNGTQASGRDVRDQTWGISVGFTGELPIKPWLGVQAELSGHYVDFKEAQFFAMAHAGIVFHF